jgi:ArsR family transcriptional regulator, arsenate/arsenite/antimonite-responsive transcriptional repressor
MERSTIMRTRMTSEAGFGKSTASFHTNYAEYIRQSEYDLGMLATLHAQLFRALGDGTRLRLLALLHTGETCVGDLVAALELPQGTVSRHLATLRRADLVEARRAGAWAFYRLSCRCAAGTALGQVVEEALQELPERRADQLRLRAAQRAGGCC